MPVDNGIGYSEWTPEKQNFFQAIIEVHMRIVKNCWYNQPWAEKRYYYFDLNAGSGKHPIEHEPGSPIIFGDKIELHAIPYRAWAVELRKENFDSLEYWIDKMEYTDLTPVLGDHNIIVPEIMNRRKGNRYGLFYSDPTGIADLPVELFPKIAKMWPLMDVLIAISGTNYKRIRRRFGKLDPINDWMYQFKKRWLIKEPSNCRKQWTFLYGTGEKAPLPEWKSKGFYDCESDDGKRCLATIAWTDEEWRIKKQLALGI